MREEIVNTQSSAASRRGKAGRVSAQRKQAAAQVQLVQTVAKLTAEVEALQQKLAQIERSVPTYHVPQSLAELAPRRLPPPGHTAMQAIMGKLEVEEALEDLLAQMKENG